MVTSLNASVRFNAEWPGLSSLMIIIVAFTIPIFTETSPKITKNLKPNWPTYAQACKKVFNFGGGPKKLSEAWPKEKKKNFFFLRQLPGQNSPLRGKFCWPPARPSIFWQFPSGLGSKNVILRLSVLKLENDLSI